MQPMAHDIAYATIGICILIVAVLAALLAIRAAFDAIGERIEAKRLKRRHLSALVEMARREAVMQIMQERNDSMRNWAHEMDCPPLSETETRRLERLMQ